MTVYIEHANLTVHDIDEAISFLKTIDPEFTVRKDAETDAGNRWVHVAAGAFYIALQGPHPDSQGGTRRPYKDCGVNHVALVVSDIDQVIGRLERAGYNRGLEAPQEQYRRRAYYIDADGLEWEFVEYLSNDDKERNLYE